MFNIDTQPFIHGSRSSVMFPLHNRIGYFVRHILPGKHDVFSSCELVPSGMYSPNRVDTTMMSLGLFCQT